MCGICGYIDYSARSNVEVLRNMVESLHHRGPDDKGFFIHSTHNASIGLGHTRLSILDLSSAGHQPMTFRNYCIVLNGEIYNFREIRTELTGLGHKFLSESDTEVVMHSFAEWGSACVSKFIGMFAFAIFDNKTNEITIVRDRAGIKPLYYYWHNGLFLFSSELKAFHKHPGFIKILKNSAVRKYINLGYIPSPECIFEHCTKLIPGSILTLNTVSRNITVTKYWDVRDYYLRPSLKVPYPEAKKELERLLVSAFGYRMISDVPVGVFLSGGYDSTAVIALLQANNSQKLRTFTIGFEDGINEAPFAKKIAAYIRTDHTEYYCNKQEAQSIIQNLPYYYDEPFADDSSIPTILVSAIARKEVKVALSADAGDEIFGGYNSYRTFINNLNFIRNFPSYLKNSASRLSKILVKLMPEGFSRYKLSVLSDVLRKDEKLIPYFLLNSYVTLDKRMSAKLFINKVKEPDLISTDEFPDFRDPLSMAMAIDYCRYLQDDILTKVDRATMSVSLEGREPFLDHRIIEFAAQLPTDFKYGTTPKMILKDIVHQYVPEELLRRPKTGFTPPVYSWLKNDLSYLLHDYLSSDMIIRSGVFNSEYVDDIKAVFLKGRIYDPSVIWKLLQFQMWFYKWMY